MNEQIDKAVNQFLNQSVAIFPQGYDLTEDQALVLGYIWSKVQKKKEYSSDSEHLSVTIDRHEWKAAFGNDYEKKRKPLYEMGFIKYTGYSNGEECASFCRDFWLTRQFWDTPNVKKILPLKKRIKNPITAAEELSKFENKTKNGVQALDPFASSNLCDAMTSLTFDDEIVTTLNNLDGITVDNLDKAKSSLRKFYLKDFWYSRSKEERLYSSITLLPKVFRRHLLMDGKPLVEIDIKAAQMTIIASLYDKWVIRYAKDKEDATEEKRRYNKMLLDGDIYTDVFNNLCKGDREKIKKVISKWLNGGSLKISMCDMLGKHFPYLAKFLSGEKSYDKENHFNPLGQTPMDKSVGLRIMKIESKIMIDSIYNAYHNKFKLLTIHDAILTTEEHVDTIISEIKNQFMEAIGIIPQITVTRTIEV